MTEFRPYNPEQDKEAAYRIWYEIGWIENEEQEPPLDAFLSAGRVLVADLHGAAECLVASLPGTIRYQTEELPLAVVTAVTTSRIARKQGLARRLTARLVAADAADGALVSALGMFEQGFYNRLGYGTGGYEHWIGFDPAQLRLPRKARVPHRLTKEDWPAIFAAMQTRWRGHGGITIDAPQFFQAELGWTTNGFGLGFNDAADGALSHFIWCRAQGEHGPYMVIFMAYRDWDQFLELMAVLRNLGDQVRLVRMREPAPIQIQDLLRHPFRQRQLTRQSNFENINRATAYWQARICDLSGCLAHTHLRGTAVRFNLALHDPIIDHLAVDAPWNGIGGEYVITLGPESSAQPGSNPGLPTLTATVGAFTRLWLGVRPATGLAVTDKLSASPELLAALDQILCLPTPKPEIDF